MIFTDVQIISCIPALLHNQNWYRVVSPRLTVRPGRFAPLNRYYIIIDEVFFDNFLVIIYLLVVYKKNNNIKIIKIDDKQTELTSS